MCVFISNKKTEEEMENENIPGVFFVPQTVEGRNLRCFCYFFKIDFSLSDLFLLDFK